MLVRVCDAFVTWYGLQDHARMEWNTILSVSDTSGFST